MTRTAADPLVEGRPVLALRDEDREAIAEAIAELLIAELDGRAGRRSA